MFYERTYIFEELLRQLLDVVHDFVWAGLLLPYPLHLIGYQLPKQDMNCGYLTFHTVLHPSFIRGMALCQLLEVAARMPTSHDTDNMLVLS